MQGEVQPSGEQFGKKYQSLKKWTYLWIQQLQSRASFFNQRGLVKSTMVHLPSSKVLAKIFIKTDTLAPLEVRTCIETLFQEPDIGHNSPFKLLTSLF